MNSLFNLGHREVKITALITTSGYVKYVSLSLGHRC